MGTCAVCTELYLGAVREENMRLLIVSCGTRNKLTQFFKAEPLTEWVVAADCSEYAPALYEADRYYIVPRMKEPEYLPAILKICQKENINALLPLQEDELMLMAENRELFEKAGVMLLVSEKQSVELCRDKYRFYQFLKKHQLPALKTWENVSSFRQDYEAGRAAFPVFAKPVRGCGSIGINKAASMELLQVLDKYSEEPLLIQQFCTGEEFGADIYVDMLDHTVKSIFVKKKLRMRAGETEKAVSYKNPELFALIQKTVQLLELYGPIDMDIFCMNGEFYISEINPRFGGGYPHAYGCGVDFTHMIAENVHQRVNEETIGSYEEGVCMMKYQDALLRKI